MPPELLILTHRADAGNGASRPQLRVAAMAEGRLRAIERGIGRQQGVANPRDPGDAESNYDAYYESNAFGASGHSVLVNWIVHRFLIGRDLRLLMQSRTRV
jgi:hypothetical protein